MTDDHSYVVTSAEAPDAYFEGYATVYSTVVVRFLSDHSDPTKTTEADLTRVLRSVRTGLDGRLDVEYVAERLGSGLYPASVACNARDASNAAHKLAGRM